MDIVDMKTINNTIIYDIRYATNNNFTKQKLYSHSFCRMRNQVALAIDAIQSALHQQHLGLIMWDAYRPPSVQRILRSYCDNPQFVSVVSNHSRGVAVDVSLCDVNGIELSMPTDFDDFTTKAYSDYRGLNEKVLKNRFLLKNIMERHGFQQGKYEWWHFNYVSLLDAPIIDHV